MQGIREAVVAGRFYPAEPDVLRKMLGGFLGGASTSEAAATPGAALSMMVPHAGYCYSGAIAGAVFGSAPIPERVILLGPNHTGKGRPWSVYASGSWRTPLGDVKVDEELASAILQGCPGTAADEAAHRFEHSLEVELPFLQVLSPETEIVPICIGAGSQEQLIAFGENLAKVVKASPHRILMVVSSDMTHYEPAEVAAEKDRLALAHMLALDAAGLYQTVRGRRITMCGILPMTVMLAAARRLGAAKGVLVRYGNSGQAKNDGAPVVGYAGVVIR
ncbi:MAG: AmmeMemoRadiSam system protein B [Deltaproteobacteria bacterium]|nr:AmmeMemoRadiSam system protein B [Deltaproteobacteria bacterium]